MLKIRNIEKFEYYSQVLISGHPISGKSRYPDTFEFGYQSLWLLYKVRLFDMLWYPDRISGYRVKIGTIVMLSLNLCYSIRSAYSICFDIRTGYQSFDIELWYPDRISEYQVINWSSGYQNPVLGWKGNSISGFVRISALDCTVGKYFKSCLISLD
jgi:hypothetical protein